MEFEWDASKEVDNLRKHGVSFAEAVESLRIIGSAEWREFRRLYSEKAKNQ
jgi:uncharacterized DUF497 family protein